MANNINNVNWYIVEEQLDRRIVVSQPIKKSIANYRMALTYVKENNIGNIGCLCEYDCCGHACQINSYISRAENYFTIVLETKFNY